MLREVKETGTVYLYNHKYTSRAWKSKYGISVHVVTIVWGLLQKSNKASLLQISSLLWLLYWLKNYPRWDEVSSNIGVSVKTARQQVYLVLAITFETFKASKIVF